MWNVDDAWNVRGDRYNDVISIKGDAIRHIEDSNLMVALPCVVLRFP